jgi:alpha-tubulin suppressor-like RCC1 family protein
VSGALIDDDLVQIPDKIMPLYDNEVNIVDIQSGYYHNLALDGEYFICQALTCGRIVIYGSLVDCGIVYSWGNGHYGQLGRGATYNIRCVQSSITCVFLGEQQYQFNFISAWLVLLGAH